MNQAQRINYEQLQYDKAEAVECAVTNLQLLVINDFETNGYVGNRFYPDDTAKDVIYDAFNEQTAELLTAMFMAGDDETKFRDASFAVKNQLHDLMNNKSYEIALKMYNEKESI